MLLWFPNLAAERFLDTLRSPALPQALTVPLSSTLVSATSIDLGYPSPTRTRLNESRNKFYSNFKANASERATKWARARARANIHIIIRNYDNCHVQSNNNVRFTPVSSTNNVTTRRLNRNWDAFDAWGGDAGLRRRVRHGKIQEYRVLERISIISPRGLPAGGMISLFVPANPNEFLKREREGGCPAGQQVNYRGQFVSPDKSV